MKSRKLLSSLLLCLLPVAANAQTEFIADGFTYRVLEGNTVALTRVPTETEGEVVVPSSVTNDGMSYTVTQINNGEDMGAFSGCAKVTAITIPASVTTIAGWLAYDATNCDDVTFEDSEVPLTYTNPNTEHVPYENLYLGRDLVSANPICFFSRVDNVVVGPKVTTIQSKLFNDNRELVSVNLSNATSLTSIGEYAFQDCQNLPSMEMPASLRFIGEEAFENCFALASVILNEGLEELGNGAFYDTDALTEITIPGSVKKIGRAPFYSHRNHKMKRFVIADSDAPIEFANYDSNYGWGEEWLSDNVVLDYFYLGRDVTALIANKIVYDAKTVEVGSKVTCINAHMFQGMSSLEQVTGMENVETIGECAFSKCTSLKFIDVSNKLVSLGGRAFDQCGITSITLPGTLKVIPGTYDDFGVFEKCYDLVSVTLGEGIEEIGSAAFYDTGSLTEITIPSSVKKIGRAAFYCNPNHCTSSMKRMVIADSDTPLEFANGTSEHSYGFEHITPASMIDYFYLGRDMTRELTDDPLVWGAKEIEIGPKVTDIGILFNRTGEVANSEDKVSSVKAHHVTPIAIGDDAFYNDTYTNATLWVPGGTVADYQAAEGWKQFGAVKTWSYVVNFAAKGHGSIAIDDETAKDGETKLIRKPNGDESAKSAYTVTLTPEKGYELTSLTQEDLTDATAATEIYAGNSIFKNPFTVETSSNHDLTYVAIFAPITYTIGYELAGGILPEGKNNPAIYTIEDNAITLVNPTRTGYNFLGWTGSDLTEPAQKVTIPAGSIGNRTYTATWKPIVYIITYDMAGGTVSKENPVTYTIETPDFTLTNPTRTGYTFTGWTGTGISGETPALQVTIVKGSIGERKYTATWKPNSYKVSFNANGGEGKMDDQLFTYDEEAKALTVNAFKRTGYNYTGWNTKADGSGTAYADKQEVKNLTATADTTITLFAQWKIITYAVTISPAENGIVTVSTLQPDYGTTLVLSVEPAKGYQLKQLTVNDTDVTELVSEDGTYTIAKVTANISVTAVFEKAEPADVNNDGTVDVADIATVIDCMAGSGDMDKAAADVNGDGTVDVADIIAIISKMSAQARQQEIED